MRRMASYAFRVALLMGVLLAFSSIEAFEPTNVHTSRGSLQTRSHLTSASKTSLSPRNHLNNYALIPNVVSNGFGGTYRPVPRRSTPLHAVAPVAAAAAAATVAARTTTATTPVVGYVYMMLLALQFAFQPVLTQKYAPKTIVKGTYVLAQEFVRLFLCSLFLFLTGSWGEAVHGWTWKGMLPAAVPALLYLVQNHCSLMAYQNLPPITYNVLNQTKTLSAALCCYLLLGQKQSKLQVVSLMVLLLAALVMESVVPLPWKNAAAATTTTTSVTLNETIVSTPQDDVDGNVTLGNNNSTQISVLVSSSTTTSNTPRKKKHNRAYYVMGVVPLLAASFISGVAGAWAQKTLKTRNSLLFTLELSALSIVILVVELAYSSKHVDSWTTGWTKRTWIPIVLNAMGGLLVGLVTKYAGAVRKGFALILGMFLSGIIQNVLSSQKQKQQQQAAAGTDDSNGNGSSSNRVTMEQWFGGALAALSLWMHSQFPVPKH